ncbi:MAG: DUF523 domain-containing protein [Candidatus Nanoarchaeia archaeon]|nr:DUF523 domain-containing protein [Candidatus Nanoarchaeia archaeon]MDD5054148.1 DUF523 domain-containing protein [Candidatus Nanoarchaeia archaeon]MDD5499251.1 DUF523 domain-containing protein [Candidatus Nanoarchaeia archaeon]
MKLCSACLLGLNTRHDGVIIKDEKVLELAKTEVLIPVCPEQLGGLSTPRGTPEIIGDKVLTKQGEDVTEQFKRGAEEVLKIAKLFNIKEAIMKNKSPSCGCTKIFDGSFTGKLIEGKGIASKLLEENGIKLISNDEL